ncbi:8-oxoguanine DNA glycosylase OGG fold protein [Streptomyces cellulosae]
MQSAMVDLMPSGTAVPERDAVLGQAIPFDRDRWLAHLPDANWWPPELDECPTAAGRRRVDRSVVFGIADRSDSVEGRRHLLTAALVWGTGTKARSVARRSRVFSDSSHRDIDARLEAALGILRQEGAVAAYYAFNNEHRISFLGPAFFTKVLYFAGSEKRTGALQPLILDRFVALALRASGTDGKWHTSGWRTPCYERYLSLVHEHARREGVLPDQIEAALFTHGKHLVRRPR